MKIQKNHETIYIYVASSYIYIYIKYQWAYNCVPNIVEEQGSQVVLRHNPIC